MSTSNDWDIAIVGMAGRFPGAPTLDQFWQNLAAGVESIARFSDQEILDAGVPATLLENPAYVKAAPVLDEPGAFDAAFFGFVPMEARTMDPQHRILLELAHEALENAGYGSGGARGDARVGVFTGCALNTYLTTHGLHPRLADDYIPTLIGNDKDFLSTRISYKLNLRGPSLTVQTACSTSLVALHLACQSLRSEESDMALAGAVSVRVPHRAGYLCDAGGVTSPDGRVRAFDARANGTVFGSGGGILVLKRLADALADGDTIRAVIKGSAVNNDGSAKAGYTAPSVDSQADAVVEALANAGVEADSIGYVEAHGSGTPVGDPIEVRALTKAFRTYSTRSGFCALGSVKTNVGHLDAAAGIAGVIKTVLALEHRQLPASLHYSEANPEIDFPSTPFYVNTTLQDWTSDGPRRAGVMATGMGGTNAHLVLEEAPALESQETAAGPHLLVWSAKTEAALDRATEQLRAYLSTDQSARMSDVEHTLQVGRAAFAHRRSLVCADREDAVAALERTDSKRVVSGGGRAVGGRRPVILLLPGVGDHYVGMGHDLYQAWPMFRDEVDRCAALFQPILGCDLRDVLYPKSGSWKRRPASKGIDLRRMLGKGDDGKDDPDAAMLNQTLLAQPALFTIEYATARLWQSLGITPDAIVGHSMGEYVAACLAGVMSLEDATRLVATRARLANDLPQGAMLAVTLPEDELRPLLSADLSISLINGPKLCVVAGPAAAVAQFEAQLHERGIISRRVANAHAFHSRMIEPIVTALQQEFGKVPLQPPAIPYVSNVTGTWITSDQATSPAYWATHATRTARFSDALRDLWRFKDAILLEAGPGRTLGVLAMQHPDRQGGGDPVVLSSLRHVYENQSDVEFLLNAVGRLWGSGVEVKWDAVPASGSRRRVPLPTYPFERQVHWLEPARVVDRPDAVPGAVHKTQDLAKWLYAPSWKRVLPRAADVTGGAESWLVFADDSSAPLSAAVIAGLKAAGRDVITVNAGTRFRQDEAAFTIDPANAADYDALLRALGTVPHRILHMWNVGDDISDAQNRGFYGLLYLAKALAAHKGRHDLELFVVSSHVQDVMGMETLYPERATLLGPCMAIGQEYPNVHVHHIDVSRDAKAELLIGELLDPDTSLFVAHRGGQRWVRTYEPAAVGPREGTRAVFRQGGVYLITGGMGKIGVAFSEYLAATYGARLVLVGRSAASSAAERIERAGGEVLYLPANVADEDAMRRVVRCTYERFGALHGVIHAAGIVGDYLEVKDSDPERCATHFQAKAEGVRVLERVLDGKPLDFCLLMSSLSSVLGGIGQAAYASANIYMDTFALRHNQTSTVPWLSVNWDVWRLDDDAAIPAGLGGTLRELGMDAREATTMLEIVLARKAAGQLVVSTGDLEARIDQWIRLESLRTHAAGTSAPPPSRGGPGIAAPRDETEQRVARIWQSTLGIDAIGIHDNFGDLGGHSLLAVKIVAELRQGFQIDLPVRALFDAPTIAQLAQRIHDVIVAEIEALTDQEAQSLVVKD